MDENSGQVTEAAVPVPKPRRHVIIEQSTTAKTSYENVSIHLINKNINISDENLQNNTKNKLPNNKAFLASGNVTASSSSGAATVATTNAQNADDTSPRSIITELNDLHSDKNKNVIKLEEVNKLSNIYDDDENCKKPVPAPRRSASTKNSYQLLDESVYENAGERKNGDGSESSRSTSSASSSSNGSSSSCSNSVSGDYCVMKVSTGAVSKIRNVVSRAAPELPEKPSGDRVRKSSQNSASYSLVDEGDYVGVEGISGKYHLRKSTSSHSLNSSQSTDSSEKDGLKFSTSSPGLVDFYLLSFVCIYLSLELTLQTFGYRY